MSDQPRKSILCPNCRKLISGDEHICPYCGIQNPGSRLKNNPLTRGWGSGTQVVKIILYVNIGMYILSLVLNPRHMGVGYNPLSLLSPDSRSLAALGATGAWIMSRSAGWWTLLSANYLHGSGMHILFNMIALYQISPLITQLYGPYRYFSIYTVSGVLGFWISCIAGVPLTIGASAALCGLIGAALYYGKSRGGLFGNAVYRQVGGWAIFILMFGFIVPGINNWAHVGGMIGGALMALALGYNERSREKVKDKFIAATCVVLTGLALGWGILRGVLYVLQ